MRVLCSRYRRWYDLCSTLPKSLHRYTEERESRGGEYFLELIQSLCVCVCCVLVKIYYSHHGLLLYIIYMYWSLLVLPGIHTRVSVVFLLEKKRAHSGVSRLRNNRSTTAENAANANPPPIAALGPEFRAKTPPATNPDATELYMSFLARYC